MRLFRNASLRGLFVLVGLVIGIPVMVAYRATADVLDQSFVAPTDAFNAILGGEFIGQTYTAGITGRLSGVNLDIFFCKPSQGCTPITDTRFPMQISIYDTFNGLPTTVLGSATLPAAQEAPLSLLITFPQVITETAGEQHAIVVNFPGSTPGPCCPFPNNGIWRGSDANPYPGGTLVDSVDGGVSWIAESRFDLHFQTYVESIPEPDTLLLVGTSLLGILGTVWRRKGLTRFAALRRPAAWRGSSHYRR